VVGTVVAAIIVVSAAYVLTDGFHLQSKSTELNLIPAQSYYSIPGGQYNAITFVAHTTSVVTGTFTNTLGVVVYLLDPAQIKALNHNGTVGAYNWSSGPIANLTVYNLHANVPEGPWSVVFLNPNQFNTTVVGFYTAIQLKST